jgi:hypothetical protein
VSKTSICKVLLKESNIKVNNISTLIKEYVNIFQEKIQGLVTDKEKLRKEVQILNKVIKTIKQENLVKAVRKVCKMRFIVNSKKHSIKFKKRKISK